MQLQVIQVHIIHSTQAHTSTHTNSIKKKKRNKPQQQKERIILGTSISQNNWHSSCVHYPTRAGKLVFHFRLHQSLSIQELRESTFVGGDHANGEFNSRLSKLGCKTIPFSMKIGTSYIHFVYMLLRTPFCEPISQQFIYQNQAQF